jgi:hypothetical protein
MKRLAALLITTLTLTASIATRSDAETIRLAVQKTGTFAWELAVIRSHSLDKPARSHCGPAAPTSSCPTGSGFPANAASAAS